jgi:hypothetical protein
LFVRSKLWTSSIANAHEVRRGIAEARDGSALDRARSQLRNAIVHGRTTPDATSSRAALSQRRNALAPQRALLGGGR